MLCKMPYFYREPSLICEISGVCIVHAETAEVAAKCHRLGCAVTDEDALIYDDTTDVIDVFSPSRYHYETVKKALMAGKHVYCEKPLTVTYQQAVVLAAWAKEKGVTARSSSTTALCRELCEPRSWSMRGVLDGSFPSVLPIFMPAVPICPATRDGNRIRRSATEGCCLTSAPTLWI